MSRWGDSNSRPTAYKAVALPLSYIGWASILPWASAGQWGDRTPFAASGDPAISSQGIDG